LERCFVTLLLQGYKQSIQGDEKDLNHKGYSPLDFKVDIIFTSLAKPWIILSDITYFILLHVVDIL